MNHAIDDKLMSKKYSESCQQVK